MEAVHADWKEYLNLLICEESHLKYMEDYHQVPACPGPVGGSPPWGGVRWGGPPCCFLQGLLPGPPSARAVPQARPALVSLPWGPGLESVNSPGDGEAQERMCGFLFW